ncbi:MAG: glutamate--tRNA ligase [Patescibacteria group bacterium]
MHIRTRIAPSPTGFMHIGNLRTALWDYFMARQAEGEFIIRVEDTDQERLVPGAIEALLRSFARIGIDWDQGPVLKDDGTLSEKGAFRPYTQTKRLDIYTKYATDLLAGGHAYYCFCSHERLEEMRAEQTALKQNPKYDRKCTSLGADEVVARIAGGERPVIRMKMPEGVVTFDDAIRGRISFDLKDMDDQVIMKSNGIPTYHLAVVIDDHLMEISHVLRGEEWLSSTPKQIVLCKMLGIQMPIYAHVPLILNPDKTKLSKRKGNAFVETFLDMGYTPAALKNFIATLGFNPSATQEIFTLDELIKAFDISRVNKSGAVMNIEKLDWMNKQYLVAMGEGEYLALAKAFVSVDLEDPFMKRAALVEKMRSSRLTELSALQEQYFTTQRVSHEDLIGKKGTLEGTKNALVRMEKVIADLPEETLSAPSLIESAIKAYIAESGLQTGLVLSPLRIALSTRVQSAGPFEYVYILQKEESLKRIREALSLL